MTRPLITAIVLLAFAGMAFGQAGTDAPKPTFDDASADIHQRLQSSLAELAQLRERMAAEKIPLSRQLSTLETELTDLRQKFQQTTRILDSRTLDLNNLRSEIKLRQEEATYLSNLLGEYLRNFESRLHIAELQRLQQPLSEAKLAGENTTLTTHQVFQAQAVLLDTSMERLMDALGGSRFEGTAVDSGGLIKRGTIAIIGPTAVFRSEDAAIVGTLEQRLGSLEPSIVPFQSPEDVIAATEFVAAGRGSLPIDPTQGNAHKVEATQETLLEHIKKGGPVMYPIFGIAGLALLVALIKWLHLTLVRTPTQKRIRQLLGAVAQRDRDAAQRISRSMPGPGGRMLAAGVEHIEEPRELIEEVMYEAVLSTRLRLNRWLPFIAITASSAPLLGLLGTVTGIMNTFTLMTVFGTGDVKTLSSGISEALITTEFGLYVAIPALLLSAFLSRKAKRIVDNMEKAAVAFLNQVGKTPYIDPETAAAQREAAAQATIAADRIEARDAAISHQQMRDLIEEILKPMVAERINEEHAKSVRRAEQKAIAEVEDISAIASDSRSFAQQDQSR